MAGPQVRATIEAHWKAMQLAKDLAGAAIQSARQYMSTREALRKARIEERKLREQEAKRKEKEEKQRKAKEEKKAARLAAKQKKEEEKKAQKERERLAREAAGDGGDGPDGAKQSKQTKNRRAGKGRDELGEGDPQVLVTRLRCHEIETKDDPTAFFKEMSFGSPCIWRARRVPLKRILQSSPDFVTDKDAAQASTSLQAEYKSWLSEFVQKCESQPEKVRSTKKASDEAQKAREALSLELDLGELFQQQMDPKTADPMVNPYFTVLERALVQDSLSATVERLKSAAGGSGSAGHAAAQGLQVAELEAMTWKSLQLVAQQQGKSFSGTMNGMYPHIIYQMEGTRAMALASILDASRSRRVLVS